MKHQETVPNRDNTKIILVCDNCHRKLSIPKLKEELRVTCPRCRYTFIYQYNPWKFSSSNKKYLLVGLIGGFVGFAALEMAELSLFAQIDDALVGSILSTTVYASGLGAVMGAAEGFFKKNIERLRYGLMTGTILGLIGGVIAGLFAQLIFSAILSRTGLAADPSFGQRMIARTIAWGVFGLLIGGSYGIKENTFGDLKFGLLGGAVGGALGGILFDPISSLIQIGDGTVGRLVGFIIVGVAVSVAVNHFREVALKRNRPEMYQPLTRRLPTNPRLSLPDPNRKQ